MKKIKAYGKKKVAYIESKENKDFFEESDIWNSCSSFSPVSRVENDILKPLSDVHSNCLDLDENNKTYKPTSSALRHYNAIQKNLDEDEKNKSLALYINSRNSLTDNLQKEKAGIKVKLKNVQTSSEIKKIVDIKKCHKKKAHRNIKNKKAKNCKSIMISEIPQADFCDFDSYDFVIEKKIKEINKNVTPSIESKQLFILVPGNEHKDLSNVKTLVSKSKSEEVDYILAENSIASSHSYSQLENISAVSRNSEAAAMSSKDFSLKASYTSSASNMKLKPKIIVTSTPVAQHVSHSELNKFEIPNISSIIGSQIIKNKRVSNAFAQNGNNKLSHISQLGNLRKSTFKTFKQGAAHSSAISSSTASKTHSIKDWFLNSRRYSSIKKCQRFPRYCLASRYDMSADEAEQMNFCCRTPDTAGRDLDDSARKPLKTKSIIPESEKMICKIKYSEQHMGNRFLTKRVELSESSMLGDLMALSIRPDKNLCTQYDCNNQDFQTHSYKVLSDSSIAKNKNYSNVLRHQFPVCSTLQRKDSRCMLDCSGDKVQTKEKYCSNVLNSQTISCNIAQEGKSSKFMVDISSNVNFQKSISMNPFTTVSGTKESSILWMSAKEIAKPVERKYPFSLHSCSSNNRDMRNITNKIKNCCLHVRKATSCSNLSNPQYTVNHTMEKKKCELVNGRNRASQRNTQESTVFESRNASFDSSHSHSVSSEMFDEESSLDDCFGRDFHKIVETTAQIENYDLSVSLVREKNISSIYLPGHSCEIPFPASHIVRNKSCIDLSSSHFVGGKGSKQENFSSMPDEQHSIDDISVTTTQTINCATHMIAEYDNNAAELNVVGKCLSSAYQHSQNNSCYLLSQQISLSSHQSNHSVSIYFDDSVDKGVSFTSELTQNKSSNFSQCTSLPNHKTDDRVSIDLDNSVDIGVSFTSQLTQNKSSNFGKDASLFSHKTDDSVSIKLDDIVDKSVPFMSELTQNKQEFVSNSRTETKKTHSRARADNSNRVLHRSMEKNVLESYILSPQVAKHKTCSNILSPQLINDNMVKKNSHRLSCTLPKASHLTESINCRQESASVAALLDLCDQNEIIRFSEAYDWCICKQLEKIGEGSYGEVFLLKQRKKTVVLKIVPVSLGTFQTFKHMIAEIKVAQCMSSLQDNKTNSTQNFCRLERICVVEGMYPSKLISAWDKYKLTCVTENVRPAIYLSDQLYVILEVEYGGDDLDTYVIRSAVESESIFKQIALSLAIAEEIHHFEHRDLHLGNILVQKTSMCYIKYTFREKQISLPSCGVLVKIIDFTLSHVTSSSGSLYYHDLAEEVSLFEQTGDNQFDIYRSMKNHLQNEWQRNDLYSNVLWLNFLSGKFLDYKYRKPKSQQHKSHLKKIKEFRNILMKCNNTIDFVIKSELC